MQPQLTSTVPAAAVSALTSTQNQDLDQSINSTHTGLESCDLPLGTSATSPNNNAMTVATINSIQTRRQCSAQCQDNGQCHYYILDRGTDTCFLKDENADSTGTFVGSEHFLSGGLACHPCLSIGIDVSGGSVAQVKNVDSANTCQWHCQQVNHPPHLKTLYSIFHLCQYTCSTPIATFLSMFGSPTVVISIDVSATSRRPTIRSLHNLMLSQAPRDACPSVAHDFPFSYIDRTANYFPCTYRTYK